MHLDRERVHRDEEASEPRAGLGRALHCRRATSLLRRASVHVQRATPACRKENGRHPFNNAGSVASAAPCCCCGALSCTRSPLRSWRSVGLPRIADHAARREQCVAIPPERWPLRLMLLPVTKDAGSLDELAPQPTDGSRTTCAGGADAADRWRRNPSATRLHVERAARSAPQGPSASAARRSSGWCSRFACAVHSSSPRAGAVLSTWVRTHPQPPPPSMSQTLLTPSRVR